MVGKSWKEGWGWMSTLFWRGTLFRALLLCKTLAWGWKGAGGVDAFSFSATASSKVRLLGFVWTRTENNPSSSLQAS